MDMNDLKMTYNTKKQNIDLTFGEARREGYLGEGERGECCLWQMKRPE